MEGSKVQMRLMKKVKGERGRGKGANNLKALVPNKDAAKFSHYVSQKSSFLFSAIKTGAFYLVGKISKFCALSPFPLSLFPFLAIASFINKRKASP
ncbi:hypothetical protein [uncultured Nostoc sp.]|uniref:hypothetical protein n=1 Tax=uncultured Nostoc sp. TaxID=340711 RepID=UPI0035CB48A6